VIATASLKAEWEEQIAKFTDLSSIIIQGSRANRLQQYQTPAFFYLTNYEQIIIDGADIQRILSPDVIILDEAQRIKNWQTKAANAVKQLKSQYAFVLTGTPLENRIDDIYSIVQFLDPHVFGPLFRFNRNFYAFDEKGKVTGYQKLDELHQRLHSVMLRRRKCDVEGQLPKRTVNNYFIGMDEEQRSRYTEYEDKVARLLAQTKSRSLYKEEFEKLQRWLACMRMICDTPFILDPECRISPKMLELEKILNELLEDKSAKIIIFSEWERMLQLVREWTQKRHLNAAWHTGSVPQHKRRADINRFKQDPDCRLFLSTDSGSVGLNLQNANIVINLDLPWNPAKLEQRIARAWRKHQKRPVQVINLVCENSIEHRMLGLLAQKQTLAQGVLEGVGDLKNMDLPSGRSAFIERMNNLMGSPPSASQQAQQAPTQDAGVLLANLDQQTLDIIQKLSEAGIITINQPAIISQASSDSANAKKKLQAQRVQHAKSHLDRAERKQRMAQVLIASNFNEEAVLPLREALQSTIHSFTTLIGKTDYEIKEMMTHHFIQKELVDQHGLPDTVVSYLDKLSGANSEPYDSIKYLVAEQQVIYQHVDERVCSMEAHNGNI
jgi:superfamily II DNA/RNA helicase